MHTLNTKQAGFTLIELLMYVAICGTLLVSVSLFLALTTQSRIKTQTIAEVDQQGQAALAILASTVRNATAITTPATSTTSTMLTVTVPTASLSPTVFDVSGGTLRIKEGGAIPTALTNSNVSVTSLDIRNLTRSGASGIVQINLTVAYKNTSNRHEYDYARTFTTSAVIMQ